jgi:hypothetical protein
VVIGDPGTLVALDPPPPGIAFPDQGNAPIETPSDPHAPYNSSPPSSGPRFGGLANWGISSEPIPPEVCVHNLEDGGIVFAYDCPDGWEIDAFVRVYEGIDDHAGR